MSDMRIKVEETVKLQKSGLTVGRADKGMWLEIDGHGAYVEGEELSWFAGVLWGRFLQLKGEGEEPSLSAEERVEIREAFAEYVASIGDGEG